MYKKLQSILIPSSYRRTPVVFIDCTGVHMYRMCTGTRYCTCVDYCCTPSLALHAPGARGHDRPPRARRSQDCSLSISRSATRRTVTLALGPTTPSCDDGHDASAPRHIPLGSACWWKFGPSQPDSSRRPVPAHSRLDDTAPTTKMPHYTGRATARLTQHGVGRSWPPSSRTAARGAPVTRSAPHASPDHSTRGSG